MLAQYAQCTRQQHPPSPPHIPHIPYDASKHQQTCVTSRGCQPPRHFLPQHLLHQRRGASRSCRHQAVSSYSLVRSSYIYHSCHFTGETPWSPECHTSRLISPFIIQSPTLTLRHKQAAAASWPADAAAASLCIPVKSGLAHMLARMPYIQEASMGTMGTMQACPRMQVPWQQQAHGVRPAAPEGVARDTMISNPL